MRVPRGVLRRLSQVIKVIRAIEKRLIALFKKTQNVLHITGLLLGAAR